MAKRTLRHELDFNLDELGELKVPTSVYTYRSGIVGGLLGGLVMVIPALLYGVVSGHGPWYPVNLVAATLRPEIQTLPAPVLNNFDPNYLLVGLAIHITVATVIGLLFAVLLPTLPGRPEIWALIVGPLLWLGATAVVLPSLNPIMSHMLDWPSFAIANIVYGVVMGFWVAHTEKVPG